MCLVVLLLAFGSQAAADKRLKGSDAVEFVELAHRKGVILEQKMYQGGFMLTILVKGRYNFCFIEDLTQRCDDRTGYNGK